MADSKSSGGSASAPAPAPAASTVPSQAAEIPKFDLVSLLSASPSSTKQLVNAKGETVPIATALKDKVVAFYYSASWYVVVCGMRC